MAHHTHSVEGRLTVEKNIVTILEASFNDHAVVQVFLDFIGVMKLDKVNHVFVVLLGLVWFD